jgi:chromosome segregation ATPase
MQNGIKKAGANEVLNFSDINPRGLKKVSLAFKRNDLKVIDLAATNRTINRNGLKTKSAIFVVAGGQTIELRINDTGDIYQIALNNKVSPFKEQKKISMLIKDISDSVKKNQASFDKSLLKKITAATRKEVKQIQASPTSTISERVIQTQSMLEQLKERVATLTALITTLDKDIEQLESELKAEKTKSDEDRKVIAELKNQRESLTKKVA